MNTNKSSRKQVILFRSIVLPVLILAFWQLSSQLGWVSEHLFPSPWSIAKDFVDLLLSGELLHHLRVSIVRAALGFLIGGSLGLGLGLFVGLFRRAEEYLDPTIQMLRTVPLLAITPLFILWFGFGELSKVLLIAMGPSSRSM